jgi:indolepyruvate ferredoxin oxidoreductase alpha subunit
LMNDIGCYSMLLLNNKIYPKMHGDDLLLSMGSSLGTATGLSLGVEKNERVIAVIGDSTFFHAGLPGSVSLCYNDDDIVLLILDNSVTAMTGQQPNPGTGYGPGESPKTKIDIEKIMRGIGFKQVVVINCFDTKNAIPPLKKALSERGPTVIISRGPCALWNDRNKRKRGEKIQPFYVDHSICRKCHTCCKDFYCPAISIESEVSEYTDERGKTWTGYSSHIAPELCDGCGVCSIVCPYTNHEARSEKDVIKPFHTPREVPHHV